MKTLALSLIAFFSVASTSFADCDYSFGETAADLALCSSINLESMQNFFNIQETVYTNPATVEEFDIKSVSRRTKSKVTLEIELLFSVIYIDSWEPGQEPSLEVENCSVELVKDYDDESKWMFSYAYCENFGEFTGE